MGVFSCLSVPWTHTWHSCSTEVIEREESWRRAQMRRRDCKSGGASLNFHVQGFSMCGKADPTEEMRHFSAWS